jgi:5-hydroxyisourate hydrolase
MAGITTHVLDTVNGKPGAGMRIEFSKREGEAFVHQKTVYTNADGRTDQMILTPADTQVGEYELRFFVEDYFRNTKGVELPDPAFIEEVPIRFSVFDTTQHYHVPMLCTPWNCTTYRGS